MPTGVSPVPLWIHAFGPAPGAVFSDNRCQFCMPYWPKFRFQGTPFQVGWRGESRMRKTLCEIALQKAQVYPVCPTLSILQYDSASAYAEFHQADKVQNSFL